MMTFPYSAWVLTPGFSPKEVVFTEGNSPDWLITEKRKWYHCTKVFPTKEAAINQGRLLLEKQKSDLNKRGEKIKKLEASLDKAEGK